MPRIDEGELKGRLQRILNRRPAVGFALGVVHDGRLELFHGHGLADIRSGRPVTEDTVFRIASITKTFTAIALMQLWEQGLVDLDAPVNDYLRAYQLVPARADWRPATLRHLLTHTAGVGEEVDRSALFRRDFGESVGKGRRLPSVPAFYRGGLRLVAEPGSRFRYTDHGLTTVGQVVEDVSGVPFERYLREHVFAPLGMADTTVLWSEVDPSRRATGYRLTARGVRPASDREWVTVGASNACSTSRDMARYLSALLAGGGNEHGSILRPRTLSVMFDAHYQPDPRIPGVGLAFWRGSADGHRLVSHQGLLPGFDSLVCVAPDDDLGVMAFTNGTRQGATWVTSEVTALVRHLLALPPDTIRTDVPQRPDVWDDLRGWYYLPGSLSDVRIRGLLGAGFEVFVRSGRLMLRFLTPVPAFYRGFELHPDDENDPYAFKLDFSAFGLGDFPLVFSRDPGTGATAVHLEWMPVSAEKKSESTNPRRWAEGASGVGAAALLARAVRARAGESRA